MLVPQMYNLEPIVIWCIFVIWYNVKFVSIQIYEHFDRSIGKNYHGGHGYINVVF